jgi:predicted metal-dependent phosphoesterase TrpH
MAGLLGLKAVAITDHDTLDGTRLALSSEKPPGLKIITGVEISADTPADWQVNGSVHILGYGIDPDNPPLNAALAELRIARDRRIPAIIEKLNRLGVDIDAHQVFAEAGAGAPGRPHVANALVHSGAVSSIDEAFERYLAKGRPAYVDKYRLDCRHAFELIRAAGGVPVLAHPFLIRRKIEHWMEPLLKCMADVGLMGVEAYYSKHPPEIVESIKKYAHDCDLLVTGGSDFHGDLTPGIEMGRGFGELYIPYEVFEALQAACLNMSAR